MNARWLLPVVFLAVGCSSAAADEDVETTGELAYTSTDAECFQSSPVNGESATEARARCLSTQADQLVDAQIARAEDPRDAALEAFKGKVRIGAGTGCFTEDVSGGFTGIWQNDIDSERDVGMIAVQAKAAVEFLTQYVRDLDGYANHFFDSVEICPNGQIGGDLRLLGSRLRIGVRSGFGGRIGIHTSNDLRDLWSGGEHLEGNALLEQVKGVRWSLLDPVGTPRTTLRKALRGLIAKLKTRLAGIEGKSETDARAELTRLVREETSAAAKDDQGRGIRERALEKIATLSATELTKLAADWQAEIETKDVGQGAEEGSVFMSDVLNHKDVKIEVSQTGLVNVQNVHQISVNVEAFLPNAGSFSRYVETTKTETNIKVNQIGIVNVQTNDIIDVRVQVLFQKAAQTASLDRVIGE